jgi:hypothetical protein
MITRSVFSDVLSVLDDSIRLAEDAVITAEHTQKSATSKGEQVTLVKVAFDKCAALAEKLHEIGEFPDMSRDVLTANLQKASAATYADILTNLASKAVFPLELPKTAAEGRLVARAERRAAKPASPQSTTDVWRVALDEADAECAR